MEKKVYVYHNEVNDEFINNILLLINKYYPYFVNSLPNTDEFDLTNIFRKQYEKYPNV